MIRCGILTFQYAHNYGAVLQAYALREFLRKENVETEIINYANLQAREMYQFSIKNVKNITDFLRKGKRCALRLKQYRLFKKFAQEYLGYKIDNPFLTKEYISGKYKNIIVGSDQVWNTEITTNDMTYFLEGVQCERRISYAASFGSSNLIDSLSFNCLSLLEKFDNISVREFEAKRILQAKVNRDVSLVVDPVFLLNKDEWKRIEKRPNGICHKFCCLITLCNDEELNARCKKLAVKDNIEIVCIHPMGWKQKCGKQLYNVGPQEFLWLVNHAEFIVTNSFHATAFSVIFKKKLITESITKNNDRISSLIQLVSGMDNYDREKLIDTSSFDTDMLEQKIAKSKEYLLENIL